MINLTKEEASELYYALDLKVAMVANGNYGDMQEPEVAKWLIDLKALLKKVGVDGEKLIFEEQKKLPVGKKPFLWLQSDEPKAVADCGCTLTFKDDDPCFHMCMMHSNPRVIVDVRGGNVQAAFSNNASLDVEVCDWDNAAVDKRVRILCKKREKEYKKLKEVY